MALRGTFLVDVDGVIRFAEANGPGEARDQAAWKRAVAALPATRRLIGVPDRRLADRRPAPERSLAWRTRCRPGSTSGLIRARSSAGEHPVYTRAVGGSKPSAPTPFRR